MRRVIVLLLLSAACASQRVPPPRAPGIRITVVARRPMEAGIAGGIVGASYKAPDGFSHPKSRVSLETRRTP